MMPGLLESGDQGFSGNDQRIQLIELQFDLPDDLEEATRAIFGNVKLHNSPTSWSPWRKALVLTSPFIAATMAAYSAGAYALAAADMQGKWNLSTTQVNFGITVFVLGFGFASIILGLTSELHGRYWVFVGSGVVFFLGTLGCPVTDSFGGMLVSRLVSGCGSSVFTTLTGGVVGDLYAKENRNTPMTLFSAAVMMGTGIGPLVSAVIVHNLYWRWIFYVQLILIGATTLGLLLLFQETRANVLLQRNCRKLNKILEERDNNAQRSQITRAQVNRDGPSSPEKVAGHFSSTFRFSVAASLESSLAATLLRSFSLSMQLLATDAIVFWFSAWASFAWAILYMQFSGVSLAYKTVYHFNNAQVGAVYTAVIVGALAGAAASIAQAHICQKHWPKLVRRPESRLYFSCGASLCLPVGLLWFGYTATAGVPYIVSVCAIGVFIFGIFVIYLAVFNYLADTYGQSASSAQATQSLCRNLLAGVFPLFTNTMLERLGFAHTGLLLGMISLALCGVSWALCFYGDAIRRRSAFAQKVENA